MQTHPHDDIRLGAKHFLDAKHRRLGSVPPVRHEVGWHKADGEASELGVFDAVHPEKPRVRLASARTEQLGIARLERRPALAMTEQGTGRHDGHDGLAAASTVICDREHRKHPRVNRVLDVEGLLAAAVAGDLLHGLTRNLAARVGLHGHRIGHRDDCHALVRQQRKVLAAHGHLGQELVHIVQDELGQHALAVGLLAHVPRLLEHSIVLSVIGLHDFRHRNLFALLVVRECQELATTGTIAQSSIVDACGGPVAARIPGVLVRVFALGRTTDWLRRRVLHQEGAHERLDLTRVGVVERFNLLLRQVRRHTSRNF